MHYNCKDCVDKYRHQFEHFNKGSTAPLCIVEG